MRVKTEYVSIHGDNRNTREQICDNKKQLQYAFYFKVIGTYNSNSYFFNI